MSGNIKIATKNPFTRIDISVLLRNTKLKAIKDLGFGIYHFTTVNTSCNSEKRSLALGPIISLRNMLNLTYLLLHE